MKDKIAFAIVKGLKDAGYDVSMTEYPVENSRFPDDVAIVGAEGMKPEAVKACTDIIREHMMRNGSGYTIEAAAHEKRRFPLAAFAAW